MTDNAELSRIISRSVQEGVELGRAAVGDQPELCLRAIRKHLHPKEERE